MSPGPVIPTHCLPVAAQLPVTVCDLSALAPQLALAREALDELRRTHPVSPESNVRAAYMSPWKSHLLNPKLEPLCAAVLALARLAARGLAVYDLAQLNLQLVVTDCWGAVYEQGDAAARHNHFPSDFACVVYLEAEEGCAPIVFGGDTPVQPRPGMLLIFPGILDHEVPDTPGRRVVVAMNLAKVPTLAAAAPAPGTAPQPVAETA